MTLDLGSRPDPAVTYAEAVDRIAAAEAADADLALAPEGRSIALLAGARTERAVVLFHGYTSAPGQFRLIAEAYRAAGRNVWVPRMPYHGYVDRLTRDLSALTASMLRDHADRAIDIAAGLGEQVSVVGLSGGGSLATWCAVERPEVADTVAISPLMQPLGVPEWTTRLLVGALPHAPDVYAWWDPKLKERLPGYGYPRFSYKGIAAFLRLVYWARHVADSRAYPVPGHFTLVRNDGENRLDSAFNARLVARLVAPERLSIYTIPARDGLLHDLVTPEEFGENGVRIALAYRHLGKALGIPLPDPTMRGPTSGAATCHADATT